MYILVTVIHVIACFILVLVVLLQAGKGADMGAVFGGASSTIFGSSGAGNFLTRLTTGAAVVFMATSLTLTYGSYRSATSTIMPESSVAPAVDDDQPAPADEQAAVEGGAPAAEGEAAPGGAPAEAPVAAPAVEAPAADAGAPAAAPPAAEAPPSQPAAP